MSKEKFEGFTFKAGGSGCCWLAWPCGEGDELSAVILVDHFSRTLRAVSYRRYNSHQHLSELGWTWGSDEGSACSIPTQIYSLSAAKEPVPLTQSTPGLSLLQVSPSAFAARGSREAGMVASSPSLRRRQNQDALSCFLQYLVPFAIVWGSSVSENHNKGKF